MLIKRVEFLGIEFDQLTANEILQHLSGSTHGDPFSYIVTPNVDHVVRLHQGKEATAEMRSAYEAARYRVCDSRILSAIGRLCGIRLPVTPGSDLTAKIFEAILRPGDQITIVGGNLGSIERLSAQYPQIAIEHHEPPMDLMRNQSARKTAAAFIASRKSRFTFLCVGSPQQEVIAQEVALSKGLGGVGLCVGASIDFITGQQLRAPKIVQRAGLEWAHRLLTNPRRFWKRYLIEGPKIFLLALRWRAGAKCR